MSEIAGNTPKRFKSKGGRIAYTMTRFQPMQKALDDFENSALKFFRTPVDPAKQNGYYRIKFELFWEPEESAKLYNEIAEQKEKKAR